MLKPTVYRDSFKGDSVENYCPTWQFYNFTSKQCECGNDIHRAVKCNATTNDVKILNCYCMTVNESGQMEVGKCFVGCDHSLSVKVDLYSQLPQNKSQINNWLCGTLNKNGTLCGRCKRGYSPVVYTYDLSCEKCTSSPSQNIAKFIAITIGPLTLFYLIVVLFKVNATSPHLASYVIFSQCVSEPTGTRIALRSAQKYPKVNFLARALLSAYGIWNLDFFRSLTPPICLDIPTPLTLALDYAGAFYSLFLILITFLLIKMHSYNFRALVYPWKLIERVLTIFHIEWGSKTSLIDVFSTFFLLSYVKILSVSFSLLIPTTMYDIHGHEVGHFLYYDASIPYFGKDHLPYAIIAIIVVSLFIVLPSLFIALYPYNWFQRCLNFCGIRCQAIHTFADCYLGWFKDGTEQGTSDRRFVMSLYLGVRISVFIFYAISLSVFTLAFSTVAIIILSIVISVLKPYKDRWAKYNTIDPVMFLMIAASCGAAVCLDISSEKAFEFVYFSAAITFILPSLPLLYITGTLLFWLLRRRGILVRVLVFLKRKFQCTRHDEHEELMDDFERDPVLQRLEHPHQYGSASNSLISDSVQNGNY